VMIAAEPQGQGVHYPLVPGYQKAEGIHVTVLGSGDKVILRRSHPRFACYRHPPVRKSWQGW
jgi:hypothetical protein